MKDISKLKKLRWLVAVLILAIVALVTYLLRGGFRHFEITPYPISGTVFRNWGDAST